MEEKLDTILDEISKIKSRLDKLESVCLRESDAKQSCEPLNIKHINTKIVQMKHFNIEYFPKNLPKRTLDYLAQIQNGTLTEANYNRNLYWQLLESRVIQKIIKNKHIDETTRTMTEIIFAKPYRELKLITRSLILFRADMMLWKSKPLLGVKKGLDQWFLPFDEFKILLNKS
jgi:hypothetical protein